MHLTRTALVVPLLLTLLAGCASNADPAPDPTSDAPPTSAPPASPSPSPSPVVEGLESLGEPVACALGREPTPAERAYLIEPGPFVDDWDVDVALEALLALEPTTPEEWATAMLHLTHMDVAEAVCEMARFEPKPVTPEPFELPDADEAEVAGGTHFAVVLDASGSMAAKSGGTTRMEEAKAAIRSFVAKLPTSATVSLRVHGHEGSNSGADKARSCASSALLHRGPARDPGFERALADVQPVGWTPLAKAIGDARGDVPEGTSTAIMYVVSDGEETCGGDPVATARSVATSGVEPIVNVIGFAVAPDERRALERIAEAGGGRYADVRTGAELRRHLEEERRRLARAWGAWAAATKREVFESRQADLRRFRELATTVRRGIEYQDGRENTLSLALRSGPSITHEDWSKAIAITGRQHQLGHAHVDAFLAREQEIKDAHDAVWEEVRAQAPEAWRELYGRR